MSRKLLVLSLLALLFASLATAGTISFDRLKENAPSTVSGIVGAVSGNTIQLAGGLITIDATGAKIVGDRGHDSTIADVNPGMLLFAQLATHDVAANAPLPARVITVTPFADATLLAPVQSVDFAAKTFTVLGRTIQVTPETKFGGRKGDDGTRDLDDLHTGDIVHVQTEVASGKLVATSVLIVTLPSPPDNPFVHVSGKVAAIDPHEWTVTQKDNSPVKLAINDRTKIEPGIHVGDSVEVGAQRRDDGTLLALVIVKKRF